MNLSRWTIEALKHKAEIAADEISLSSGEHGGTPDPESVKDWTDTAAAIARVLAEPTTAKLGAEPLAVTELANYSDKEPEAFARGERIALLRDLARCGYLDEFDPASVWSRKPRTMEVDGKRYVIG